MRHPQSLRALQRHSAITGAVALLQLSLGASAVHAQTAAAPAAAASAPAPAASTASATAAQASSADTTGDKNQLATVVITANKRVERLEQVPAAVTVLGSELLERNNVANFEDVISLSPALTVTYGTTPANNGINMRGIGTSSIGIGVESDVAVIMDDIPMGMQFMAFQGLTDIQQIEILKGPQSTLFGKSAIAGAINITTKPVTGPMGGSVSLMGTSDGETRFKMSYGGSINDQFGFRISAARNNFAGNVENLATGGKVNGSSGSTLMGKFVWHPTESLDVEYMPRYNHTDANCCVYVLTSMTNMQSALLNNVAGLPASTLLAGITPSPYNTTVRNDFPTGLNSSDTGNGLKITYELPSHALLTSITSGERYVAQDFRDQDFTDYPTLMLFPLANGKPAGVDQGYTQYGTYNISSNSQELRLTSPDEGSLRYVVGLWYSKNTVDRTFIRGYNGIALSTPIEYFATTSNENRAVFGQASWAFRANDTLLAGVRFNRQVSGYTMALGNPPPGAFVTSSYFSSLNNGENSTTGKLSYQHQFNRDVMAYVMTSTGYKGDAYDITSGLTAATAANQPVHPETGRTVEVGLKGNFLENRMTLNLAAFHSTFSDYQQNSGSYLPGTTTYVTRLNSIGGVQTHGLEADLAALITHDLLLNASFAYTIATVTSWPNAPCYSVSGAASSLNGGFNAACQLSDPAYGNTNVQDLTGAVMPNAPKLKGSVSGQYTIPLEGRGVDAFVNGSLRFQSHVETNINQDPTLGAPGYSITNLGMGIKSKSGAYQLSFFVNNLFDKHYANTGFSGLGNWSSKKPNPAVTVLNSTWTPARDAFRYEAVRLDMKF